MHSHSSVEAGKHISLQVTVKRPPLYLLIPAVVVSVCMVVPLVYLFLRAGQAQPDQLVELVFRPRNFQLLLNTLALTGGVLFICTFLALPLAWLVTRSDIRAKRLLTILAVVPLAVPGYVMAYALLGVGVTWGCCHKYLVYRYRISLVTGAPCGRWRSIPFPIFS
ncbi:hypothetical protein [Nitrincola sp. A-D6]|uniref:hypothetical protein n=1 Tax=Nitrincola sp. A-D6 TaxID=1545442 RepID=UPI00190F6C9F|nr:hypothetical protein [Nitrincola sp. A-D6]